MQIMLALKEDPRMKELVELRNVIDETANRIEEVEPNPDAWDVPVLYLLETLEVLALPQDPELESYKAMLEKVISGIEDRLDQQGW
jgi:hypothetical protein